MRLREITLNTDTNTDTHIKLTSPTCSHSHINRIAQKNLAALNSAKNKKISNTVDKRLLVNDSSKSINLNFEHKLATTTLNPGENLEIKIKSDSIQIYKNKKLLSFFF